MSLSFNVAALTNSLIGECDEEEGGSWVPAGCGGWGDLYLVFVLQPEFLSS